MGVLSNTVLEHMAKNAERVRFNTISTSVLVPLLYIQVGLPQMEIPIIYCLTTQERSGSQVPTTASRGS